ncbi:MAG: hypothetical protein EA377_09495 [Phycisphaerales bacterium]|nr:MAG: hypothetical protein EA377_09495 [Phycisphaerales bacterium]
MSARAGQDSSMQSRCRFQFKLLPAALWQRSVVSAVSAVALMLICGCASVTPADPNRLTAANEQDIAFAVEALPKRYPALLRDHLLHDDADGDLEPAVIQIGDRSTALAINPRAFELLGLVMPADADPPMWVVGESLIVRTSENRPSYLAVLNRLDETRFPELQSRMDSPLWQNAYLPRWRFTLNYPEANTATTPRGMVIHLVSIGDRSYESRVTETLRARGWATLEVLPSPVVIRFQQRHPDREPSLVPAERISETLDEFGADYAHAVYDMMTHLREEHEEFRDLPLVIIGYSAGALATPTVAARLLPDLDAVVMIGGGVNVAGIMLDSSVANIGSRLRREGGTNATVEVDALPEAYLSTSRYDPYHTAPLLRSVPTLMIHGSLDQIVPASYGRQLHERLGRPEKWSYPLGHALLFWWLPTQAGRIADWIEREVFTDRF